MQPFFFIHLSVKWGEYLWLFTAELTPIWKRGYKAFKVSVMKSIQIEEHRFGVEPEIVVKLARTAVSHQQQRDVARRAAGLPARENRAQLFRHARAAVPALVRLIPPADCILLIHVLYHLASSEDQEPLVRACLDRIKSGGKLIIAEIDRKPWWKFVLTQLADHMLYPGQGIHYRFPESMAELLKKFPVKVETEVMHQDTPFFHITYICAKP
jgi:hypothetical protein